MSFIEFYKFFFYFEFRSILHSVHNSNIFFKLYELLKRIGDIYIILDTLKKDFFNDKYAKYFFNFLEDYEFQF